MEIPQKPSLGRVAVSAYPDLERHCVATEVACERKCHRHWASPPFGGCSQTAAALPAHLIVILSVDIAIVNKNRPVSQNEAAHNP